MSMSTWVLNAGTSTSASTSTDINSSIPLPPPPPEPSPTLEPLWSFYAKWASENGFFIKRSRTNSRKGKLIRVYAQCDRSRPPRPYAHDKPRVRNTTSRLTNCPFSLVFSVWTRTKLWTARVRNPYHNHEPALLSSIPSYRNAMTVRFEAEIVEMLKKGMPPKEIVTVLQTRHHFAVISTRNVYELKRRLKLGATLPSGHTPSGPVALPGPGDEQEPTELEDSQALAEPEDGEDFSVSEVLEGFGDIGDLQALTEAGDLHSCEP